MKTARPGIRLIVLLVLAALDRGAAAQSKPLVRFDFADSEVVRDWRPVHDVSSIEAAEGGMLVRISGSDPYVIGPPRDLPKGQPLWLHIRMRSAEGGGGQVFYSDNEFTEQRSVRFAVPARKMIDVRLPMPPLGPHTRFRIDPPGSGGTCLVALMGVEVRPLLADPEWPRPVSPALDRPLRLRSGALELLHGRTQIGAFALRIAGQPMAIGHTRPLIGYLPSASGPVRWLDLAKLARTTVVSTGASIEATARLKDSGRAAWSIVQRFAPGAAGCIEVSTTVTVSQDRNVVYLPLLTLLPGAGSFGEHKGHGLLAGLEYLDDEPSSSRADIETPEANRRVPDSLRLTMPLMAVQAKGRYVALAWEPSVQVSALYDSPDRTFHSGGHLMGLLFPGSNGEDREQGRMLPYGGTLLKAGKPLVLRAQILGGTGDSVVAAVRQYVALHPLPAAPPALPVNRYVALAAAGWTLSKIQEDHLFRHAWGANFPVQHAADPVMYLEWLARKSSIPELSKQLDEQAGQAALRMFPGDVLGGVSHVRQPALPLISGHAVDAVRQAREQARASLGRFEQDGRVIYHPSPGGLDYGRTHFEKDANGLTAQVVASLLENAALCGDRELMDAGVTRLRAMDRFLNTAPRGAQTWEVPLHTPDILASANLVKAYTLGYELTGDRKLLDHAIYWAWTGVPFVYLRKPADGPVGLYATIPVLGATQWVAPNWMGLPVQWCGLVYSDALYRLAELDQSGPWRKLAEGITISGEQQTWPLAGRGASRREEERQGLLPDSFDLRAQTRNDSAINPGTLQANAVRHYGGPLYDRHVFRSSGIIVHAPGQILVDTELPDVIRFIPRPWETRPYQVLIVDLKSEPHVRIDGKETPLTAPHAYLPAEGALILQLQGVQTVEVILR